MHCIHNHSVLARRTGRRTSKFGLGYASSTPVTTDVAGSGSNGSPSPRPPSELRSADMSNPSNSSRLHSAHARRQTIASRARRISRIQNFGAYAQARVSSTVPSSASDTNAEEVEAASSRPLRHSGWSTTAMRRWCTRVTLLLPVTQMATSTTFGLWGKHMSWGKRWSWRWVEQLPQSLRAQTNNHG